MQPPPDRRTSNATMLSRRLVPLVALVVLAACATTPPAERGPLYQWTQMAPDGQLSLRAIVAGDGDCPQAVVDGLTRALQRRAPADSPALATGSANPAFAPAFAVTSCELTVPRTVREARLGDRHWPLPPAAVKRIVVVGDTGCRVQVPARGASAPIQDCLDPAAWPWPRVAAAAARAQPDLVIHVGDYHYREYCDDPVRCAPIRERGVVVGYDWPGWKADFFAPAEPLLARAPWIVVRGNHENCDRAGAGWQRLLSPFPYQPCPDQAYKTASHSVLGNNLTADAYRVDVSGQLTLIVADNAGYQDYLPAEKTPADPGILRASLSALLAAPTSHPVWLVQHKPLWYDLLPAEAQPNALQATLRGQLPATVAFVLAGHEHAFQTINFAPAADGENHRSGRPAQLIVGNSGTQLEAADPTSPFFEGSSGAGSKERSQPNDLLYQAAPAASGIVLNRFGFLLLENTGAGWLGTLVDPDGASLSRCRLDEQGKAIVCSFPERAAAPAAR